MEGHLDLVARVDALGQTVLRRQSFAAPIHISKPHHDAGWLVVNLASPTPGLFAGDRVRVGVEVESGARLLLTAPSANRLHTMKEDHAELTQEFRVARGACLDVWPEYLIPQAGSRYRQRTRVGVEEGGTLLWTETMAPGRAARGEVFQFSELRFASDIFHGSRHLLRERYRLAPGEAGVAALIRHFPQAYYASVLVVAGQLASVPFDFRALHASSDPRQVWLGATQVSPSAIAAKIVAGDSPTLRAEVARVRAALQAWMGLSAPMLRRITGAPVV